MELKILPNAYIEIMGLYTDRNLTLGIDTRNAGDHQIKWSDMNTAFNFFGFGNVFIRSLSKIRILLCQLLAVRSKVPPASVPIIGDDHTVSDLKAKIAARFEATVMPRTRMGRNIADSRFQIDGLFHISYSFDR